MSSNLYLDNKSFTKEIEISLENVKLTNEAVLMYKSIVDNMIKNKDYNGYPIDTKVDMQNSAYYFFLKYWKGYKIETKNAFSYFTKMCENGFLQEINRYYKYNKKFDIIYNESKQNIFDTTKDKEVDDDYC